MKYPRIYSALKKIGFSAFKAVEIIYDAKRGDAFVMVFIRMARRLRS